MISKRFSIYLAVSSGNGFGKKIFHSFSNLKLNGLNRVGKCYSNKAPLIELWKRFPNHPLLLETHAYDAQAHYAGKWVRRNLSARRRKYSYLTKQCRLRRSLRWFSLRWLRQIWLCHAALGKTRCMKACCPPWDFGWSGMNVQDVTAWRCGLMWSAMMRILLRIILWNKVAL